MLPMTYGQAAKRAIGICASLCLLISACSVGPGQSRAQAGGSQSEGLTSVRVGITPYEDHLSIQMGYDLGFFEKAGLKLDIKKLDYEVVTEAVASNAVDLGANCETSILTSLDSFPKHRFVDILFSYEGGAIWVPGDKGYKTYDDLLKELGDPSQAQRATIEQLRGKSIFAPSKTDMELNVGAALSLASMGLKDVSLIDMNPDDGLAAFLAKKGDAYYASIDQFPKLMETGNVELINLKQIGPEAVTLCGFSASDDYAKAHPDVLTKFLRGQYLTMQYLVAHEDDAFARIAALLKQRSGVVLSVAQIRNIYHTIDQFPATGEDAYKLFVAPNAPRLWKTRVQFAYDYYHNEGTIRNAVNVDDVVTFPSILKAYMQQYEPDAYKRIYG